MTDHENQPVQRYIASEACCAHLTREQCMELYKKVLEDQDTAAMRHLAKHDLFFLAVVVCARKDMDNPWLYARIREVEADPNRCLDLWAREHYKSTIITFLLTIQDILRDPNVTIGIFSHSAPIAKAFLTQIKDELEKNRFMQALFRDVLYQQPKRSSSKWSVDRGLVVKRKSNPKEATVEAHGLVDGQPTSRHFTILVYDDVVTKESVSTPDQITKTTEAWEMSLNLGAHGGVRRTIGTRYHFNDTYRTMMDRGSVKVRLHPATDDGTADGKPVFLTKETLEEKRRDMGPYTFGSQMLQNPVADNAMGFHEDWLMYYDRDPSRTVRSGWNFYLLVDPASGKKKNSDYTVMVVIGLAPDANYYLVDAVRDRMNLTERASKLFTLHRRYRPVATGYEEYGLQADVEHIQGEMERRNYRFQINRLGGNQMSKEDRIRRLVPLFEQRRFFLPRRLMYTDLEGRARDYVSEFVNDEYLAFPVAVHDDMLDVTSRIQDPKMNAVFPLDSEHTLGASDTDSTELAQMDYNPLEV